MIFNNSIEILTVNRTFNKSFPLAVFLANSSFLSIIWTSFSLQNFLINFYQNEAIRPKEILVSSIQEIELLEEIIDVNFVIPQKGRKKELLDMASNNAKISYENNRKLYELLQQLN